MKSRRIFIFNYFLPLFYFIVFFYRYDDLKKQYAHEIDYIPGGAGQNALRTASVRLILNSSHFPSYSNRIYFTKKNYFKITFKQWILKFPNVATFMGCIGKDHNADIMKQKASEVGLNALYQINESVQTGTCAVLITGNDRSLVAHLGAANCFTEDHLDNEHHWSFIEKAKIFYISVQTNMLHIHLLIVHNFAICLISGLLLHSLTRVHHANRQIHAREWQAVHDQSVSAFSQPVLQGSPRPSHALCRHCVRQRRCKAIFSHFSKHTFLISYIYRYYVKLVFY